MLYYRLTKGLKDYGKLYPETTNIYDIMGDSEADWYQSNCKYKQEHYEIFKATGTVSGIVDLVTNRLWFDFDCKSDPEKARPSAITLCKRLVEHGIDEKDIAITFSGQKGFGVEVATQQTLLPEESKLIAFSLASDLDTFDEVVYNPGRLFRVPATKHPVTGLYKTPLTLTQLNIMDVEQIKKLAANDPNKHADMRWAAVMLPPAILNMGKKVAVIKVNKNIKVTDVDFSTKLKGWPNCKWALFEGYGVDAGDRHEKLLCIISHSKATNAPKETAYYNAKRASEKGAERYGCEKADKREIWRDVESVYSANWKGGTYTCKDGKYPWLTSLCEGLGPHKCRQHNEDSQPIKFADLQIDFKTYVKNIDKNTILTGLPSLDKYVFLSTGANVGIIGAAGSGKTSVGLEILNNTSKAGVRSVVASLDMARNRIFEKIMYRISGLDRSALYKVFQEDREGELIDSLTREFGNVNFFKSSCPTVKDIKEYVHKCNEEGPKVKLVVIDYFERINSDFSDDTAASKKIAGELQDLVDELDVCLVTLVQPNKAAIMGGPDQPIYDYTKIKGSSFVYQAFRIILSCWRPFYNPKSFANDHYMQMAVLKNDLGELNEMSFGWEGKRGLITELEIFQEQELRKLLDSKELLRQKNDVGF